MEAMSTLAEIPLERRAVRHNDIEAVYRVYRQSPGYFELIGAPIPEPADVVRELEAALQDPRRRIELIYAGPTPVGYLDYKLDHPQNGEAVISLVLVAEPYRGRGIGQAVVSALESELRERITRLYAVVYGDNAQATKFFTTLGYRYFKDGGPAIKWYVKDLRPLPADRPI